ncbi:MAG: hypothetical protein WDZ31_03685 [Phycisphaeraceae bacterium]
MAGHPHPLVGCLKPVDRREPVGAFLYSTLAEPADERDGRLESPQKVITMSMGCLRNDEGDGV